ncbi:ATP-binding protein, partial [Amnimonas aquatica]
EYNSIAYLGIPLTTTQGQTLGSFCAVRSEPYQWSEREITVMRALAHAVITEIELRLLASQFRDSYHELRTLSLQRDEMIDMLVHDLRNPLSSLIAGMHLVRDDNPLTPAQQRALDIAQRGGETLLAMINDLLDSSRAKAVGMQLDLGPVAITEVCQAALEQVTHLAERSGVRLETDIALGLPPLRADRGKLRRVLVNLLANAIQHTPAGGMVSLEARADAGGRTLELIVSDTGLGIAPQQVDSLFDKYGTSSSSPGQTHSTGLGLPFCKLVAEAHGGDIQVASSISHGASFRLTLPLPARTH